METIETFFLFFLIKKSYSKKDIDIKTAFNTFFEHKGAEVFLKFLLYSYLPISNILTRC